MPELSELRLVAALLSIILSIWGFTLSWMVYQLWIQLQRIANALENSSDEEQSPSEKE